LTKKGGREMSRYKVTMSDARNIQKWALKASGAGKFLDDLPKLSKTKKIKKGLYADYKIDESELEDDLLDYCTPEVASVWAVNSKGKKTQLAGIRAYPGGTYWLEFGDNCEVDTAENWFDLYIILMIIALICSELSNKTILKTMMQSRELSIIKEEYKKMLKSAGRKT